MMQLMSHYVTHTMVATIAKYNHCITYTTLSTVPSIIIMRSFEKEILILTFPVNVLIGYQKIMTLTFYFECSDWSAQ